MATETKLISWILLNAGKLDLEIERLSWIQEMLPNYTEIGAHITCGKRRFSGWGTDPNPDLAFAKAFAEAAERAVLSENQFNTSNGMAAHSSLKGAREAAVRELCERDLILCHFYTNTPFSAISASDDGRVDRDTEVSRIKSWFNHRSLNLYLFTLTTQLAKGVLAVADGLNAPRPSGFILGAGMKENTIESAKCAGIEAARAASAIHQFDSTACNLSTTSEMAKTNIEEFGRTIPQDISLSEFYAKTAHSFEDHGKLALNIEYAEKVSHLFMSESYFKDNQPNSLTHQPSDVSAPEIQVEEIHPRCRELVDCPLFFVRASSAHYQNLFLGQPDCEKLNLNRLSRFAGRHLSTDDLLLLPHPLR